MNWIPFVIACGVVLGAVVVVTTLLRQGARQDRQQAALRSGVELERRQEAEANLEAMQDKINETAARMRRVEETGAYPTEVPIVAGELPGYEEAVDEALELVEELPVRAQHIEVPRVAELPEGAVLQGRWRPHDECLDHYKVRDQERICRQCWRAFYGEKAAA